MSSQNIYYTYKLVHTKNSSFYFGSRKSSNIDPYQDLGRKYFSSSKKVKEIGFNNFYYCVLEIFTEFDLCYWNEQSLIRENINNPLCLNKSYFVKENSRRIFSMSGKQQTQEHVTKRTAHRKGVKTNRTISKEQQKLMLKGKNKKYPAGYNQSEESKQKNRDSHLGKTHTSETKNKMSVSAKGKPKSWLKNRKFSAETIAKQNKSREKNREQWSLEKRLSVNKKISDKHKGKPKQYETVCSKEFLCRISDKKVLNKGNACQIFPDLKQYF